MRGPQGFRRHKPGGAKTLGPSARPTPFAYYENHPCAVWLKNNMSGHRPQTYVSCDLKHEAFLWAVMATPTFNKFGRVYERGKAISQDIKNNIIQDIV